MGLRCVCTMYGCYDSDFVVFIYGVGCLRVWHKMFSCLSVVVWILFCLWLVVSDVDLCFIYVC